MKRLYFDELLLSRIEWKHIHVLAKRGDDSGRRFERRFPSKVPRTIGTTARTTTTRSHGPQTA